MKNKTFRNALHIVIGFAIGYNLTSITDFNTYPITDKIVGVVAITFIGFWIGYFWEWLQLSFLDIIPDFKDCARTALGTWIGSVLVLCLGLNFYIVAVSIAISIGLLSLEFSRIYKDSKK